MSGRAGRRGMDDRGIVILMVDEKMSPTIGKQLLKVRGCSFIKESRNTCQSLVKVRSDFFLLAPCSQK